MSDTTFAMRFAQELMQKYSYELGDITNKYPPELHVFCVAVMKSTAAALEAQFDETDRQLLEILLKQTTAVLLPTKLDPRRNDR